MATSSSATTVLRPPRTTGIGPACGPFDGCNSVGTARGGAANRPRRPRSVIASGAWTVVSVTSVPGAVEINSGPFRIGWCGSPRRGRTRAPCFPSCPPIRPRRCSATSTPSEANGITVSVGRISTKWSGAIPCRPRRHPPIPCRDKAG